MQAHNHQTCISDAILHAERVCDANGTRLTPTRKKVLQLIWESHQAAKAYDLLEKIKPFIQGATPMTIYRALQFLQDQGLVHRVETLNAYVGCTHKHSKQHEAQLLLICETCQQIEEESALALMSHLNQEAEDRGFLVKRKTLEIYGTCASCQASGTCS